MTYAFTFDASACSGCKACQVACKDKNNLPPGVLWRRVYEVSGGSWQKQGQAWGNDVFAYNISIACNHCEYPKCAGVCPTDAYVVRDDGIVFIDETKCIGCGYCNWACPYAAPQYNPERGKMAKCNFCFDYIDAGLPPACVAACPLRVLDYVSLTPSPSPGGRGQLALWKIPALEHPFPLPNDSRTEPHLAIQPHAGMLNGLQKVVSNREETRPQNGSKVWRLWSPKLPDFGEWPLVAFTLLGQMAAGIAVLSFFSGPLSEQLLVILGGLIGLAGLASLSHLGSPGNAWRAAVHLKKSWLSREILMFGLFGGSWLIALRMPGMGKFPLALCAVGLVFSMAQVYRLRSMPDWNSNRTLLAFATSALLLGGLGLKILTFLTKTGILGNWFLSSLVLAGLIFALLLSLSGKNQAHQTAGRLRLGLTGLSVAGMVGAVFIRQPAANWLLVLVFMLVLLEEGIGRWLFYQRLGQRRL